MQKVEWHTYSIFQVPIHRPVAGYLDQASAVTCGEIELFITKSLKIIKVIQLHSASTAKICFSTGLNARLFFFQSQPVLCPSHTVQKQKHLHPPTSCCCLQWKRLCSSHGYLLAPSLIGSDGNVTPGWTRRFSPLFWRDVMTCIEVKHDAM